MRKVKQIRSMAGRNVDAETEFNGEEMPATSVRADQVLDSALADDDFDKAVWIAQAEYDHYYPDVVRRGSTRLSSRRAVVEEGDWIAGTGRADLSKSAGHGKLIYAMSKVGPKTASLEYRP